MGFTRTLFDLVGGERKLDAFVEEFADRLKANPDLGPLYPDDMTHLKSAYKEYAMEMLGGPRLFSQNFGGRNLSEAHKHIPITKERADEMIQCAMETMEHFHVPKTVQQSARERLEGAVQRMINA
jgi:hemoglobin